MSPFVNNVPLSFHFRLLSSIAVECLGSDIEEIMNAHATSRSNRRQITVVVPDEQRKKRDEK